MGTKKRTTKLTLDDIPKVNSEFRLAYIKTLTDVDPYKEAIEKNSALGFSTEELKAIEEKYKDQRGLFNDDIQSEINKKGWLIKPTTIKQYIQKDQLPMSMERVKLTKGAGSLYPLNFMRHLNFVRFFLNAGREISKNILNAPPPTPPKISDYSLLQSMANLREIYDNNSSAFFMDYFFSNSCSSEDINSLTLVIDNFNSDIDIIDATETAINGNRDRKSYEDNFDNADLRLKIFKTIKEKLQTSNNNFDDLKVRLMKYKVQLQEIKHLLDADIRRKYHVLVEEMKNTLLK